MIELGKLGPRPLASRGLGYSQSRLAGSISDRLGYLWSLRTVSAAAFHRWIGLIRLVFWVYGCVG